MELDLKDLRIDIFSNIAEASVKITHLPTGKSASANHKSQLEAKSQALIELKAKLNG